MTKMNVDNFIERLIQISRSNNETDITENEIRYVCSESKKIFLAEDSVLKLKAPIKIIGTLYGEFKNLVKLFELGGLPAETRYLFLGNYVDIGSQSIETICLLLAFKIKYQDSIFLLRGSHECLSINRIYGFYDECKSRYNKIMCILFNDCFNALPFAAIVNGRIFCVHSGLSKELESVEQISKIIRPTDIPDSGLLCDLLWSDPDKSLKRWSENDCGVSSNFGAELVDEFLQKHGFDLICRSHQAVSNGYEYFANNKLVTVSSYSGLDKNNLAIMCIDESLSHSFQIIKSEEK